MKLGTGRQPAMEIVSMQSPGPGLSIVAKPFEAAVRLSSTNQMVCVGALNLVVSSGLWIALKELLSHALLS
jgi:hypothetical protein